MREVMRTEFHPPTLTPAVSLLDRLLRLVSRRRRRQARSVQEAVAAVNAYHRWNHDRG